ncbi:MAG: glycerate kinase [Acidimicrobiaceae bacterium]|nr:glycerate kinase [Acidimicrobiaceae bacterium]
MPHLVAAPDKYRGTASAAEIAAAALDAAALCGWTGTAVPLADGGEGTLEAVGGERRVDTVSGPLLEPVHAQWRLLLEDGRGPTAVIEMALASGMALLRSAADNDPVGASTFGTGELIAAALRAGARRVVVGCGGSATTDGGSGMLAGLGDREALRGVELLVACDVTTPFLDAARVFGPQKGARPEQVTTLSARLEAQATQYLESYGVDVTVIPGAGAAGGLAGALAALGGKIVSGFDLVAELVELDEKLLDADLVMTGEGRLDATSLSGKVVSGVLRRTGARAPVLVVAGTTDGTGASELAAATATPAELVEVVSLVERFGRDRALGETATVVGEAVRDALADHELRWTRGDISS